MKVIISAAKVKDLAEAVTENTVSVQVEASEQMIAGTPPQSFDKVLMVEDEASISVIEGDAVETPVEAPVEEAPEPTIKPTIEPSSDAGDVPPNDVPAETTSADAPAA